MRRKTIFIISLILLMGLGLFVLTGCDSSKLEKATDKPVVATDDTLNPQKTNNNWKQ